METNYRSLPKNQHKLPIEKYRPIQTETKKTIDYSFLLDLSTRVGYPFSFLASLFRTIKRKPFQHEEKDVPNKLRQAIGEKLEDYCEMECNKNGRRLFLVEGKSGICYETYFRENLSKILKVNKVS